MDLGDVRPEAQEEGVEGMATVEEQITAHQSCGESANRMCQILTGSSMSDIMENHETVDLSEADRVAGALRSMRSLAGYILVRLNVSGGGAGHAYIFLSVNRGTNEPVQGHVYQTNVGVHRDSAFGIKEWIDDPKSQELVDLSEHLDALKPLCGLSAGPDKLASVAYGEQFTLTSRPLKTSDALSLRKEHAEGRRSSVRFLWTPMNASTLYKNIIKIKAITDAGRVKTQGTFF